MEEDTVCKTHSLAMNMFCKDCKQSACLKCFPDHKKKGCKNIIPIFMYVEEEILPRYKTKLDNLKQTALATEEGFKDFFQSSKGIKDVLVKLKVNLQALLGEIDESLGLLETVGGGIPMNEEVMKRSLTSQYEELKEAIESSDINYISTKINRPFAEEIGDSEKHLIKAVTEALKKTVDSAELSTLKELLKDLNLRYRLLEEDYGLSPQSNFVYGISFEQPGNRVLCKYDIQKKKLLPTISVPQECSVIRMEKRIFISGGYNPCISNNSEFIEKTNNLVTKAPMKISKCLHALQAVSNKVFASVGGYDTNSLSCCEEYSIIEDKWITLPSLNTARRSPATVFLNDKYLYAIGASAVNVLEMLNYNEKKNWLVVNLQSDFLVLDKNPAAIPISNEEAIILCGGNTLDTGILNFTTNIIMKGSNAKVADNYHYNTVDIINRKGYILGYNGHMHIYDLDLKEFYDIVYASIKP